MISSWVKRYSPDKLCLVNSPHKRHLSLFVRARFDDSCVKINVRWVKCLVVLLLYFSDGKLVYIQQPDSVKLSFL